MYVLLQLILGSIQLKTCPYISDFKFQIQCNVFLNRPGVYQLSYRLDARFTAMQCEAIIKETVLIFGEFDF